MIIGRMSPLFHGVFCMICVGQGSGVEKVRLSICSCVSAVGNRTFVDLV